MGVSIALQYAREIGLPVIKSMIRNVVQYLLDAYYAVEQRWHAVPESINVVPHARWWSFDELW